MKKQKPRCKYCMLVEMITSQVLGKKRKDIELCEFKEDVDQLIEAGVKCPVIWFTGTMPEPIFQFWRLWRAEVLTPDAHVIFTDVKDSPLWRDLADYQGGRFGNMYVLSFDDVTQPGTKPSQKGMYQGEV